MLLQTNIKEKIKEILPNRFFLYLWIEQTFTQIAYHLVNFSLIISVFKLTNSNFSVGILLICFYLPSAVFVILAGLTSDLFYRKKIILITNIIWASLVLLLSFFTHNFTIICLIAILIQITDEFFYNAVNATLPDIVKNEQLLSANSLFNITFYSSMVIASFLVSILTRFISPKSPLYLASILTLTSAYFVSKIKFNQKIPQIPKNTPNFLFAFKEIFSTWKTVKNLTTVKVLIVFLVISNSLLSLVYAIVPGLLANFGIDVNDFSFVLILPLGLGLILGNLYLQKFKHKLRKIDFIQSGLLIMGVFILILAFIPKSNRLTSLTQKRINFEKRLGISIPLSLIFTSIGFSAILTFIPAATSFQENLPPESRGRISSLNQVLIYILSTIFSFSSGAISDSIGFFPLLLTISTFALFAGFFSRRFLIKRGILKS